MKKYIFIPFLLLLFGCRSTQNTVQRDLPFAKVYTATWMQRSAEYEALCYQAFNGAKSYLYQSIEAHAEEDKPLAIITDIDETVLDNSPNAVHQGLKGELFDAQEWTRWCAMAVADTVPGAVAFLREAAENGIEIFYVSNRIEAEREGTLLNLQKYDFPNADDDHLLLKTSTSSKDERRAKILETHDVIIYMGDQLTDFPGYGKDPETIRSDKAIQDMNQFGGRFILLPNPNYGEWESALSDYKRLNPSEQAELIKSKAKNY